MKFGARRAVRSDNHVLDNDPVSDPCYFLSPSRPDYFADRSHPRRFAPTAGRNEIERGGA